MVKREFITKEQIKHKFPIMENDFGMVINETLHKELDKIPTVEAIPKDDYEARLKADMVAMLTEIQLEIEEKKFLESSCSFMDKTEEKNYAVYTDDISDIIQQKIDALKENTDGNMD